MAKLAFFALITAIVGVLTFAGMSASDAGDAPCVHKEFKTEMVKSACEKGGQKAAKAAMQVFNKDKKIKSCTADCHVKLAPNYELKPGAFKQFEKLGGKLIADPKADPKKDPKPADPKKDPKAEPKAGSGSATK
jgi:hypothetical protein